MILILPSTQAFSPFTWGRRFGLLGPLPRLVRLASLTFEWGTLEYVDVAALAHSLGLLTDLKRLELPGLPYIGTEAESGAASDVSALAASLASLLSLEHLVLGHIGFSTDDMVRMLPSLTALQYLDLRNNNVTSDIAPALAALKALTHLDLNGHNLWNPDKSMAPISASLSLLTGLVYLALDYCNGGNGYRQRNDDVAGLGHSLPPSLTYLSMYQNKLGAAGIQALVTGLHQLTALRLLDLTDNIRRDVDSVEARTGCGRALAGCLERMTGLTSLILASNSLGPDCVPALAGSLQRLQNLQDLNLAANLLGAGARLLIDNCLQHLRELRSLDLSGNELGVSGVAQQLAACLLRMPKLRELDLGYNMFGDEGFSAFASSLVKLPSLTSVSFECNKLTVVAIEALVTALRTTGRSQAMPALQCFNMGTNNFGGSEALVNCLEHMPNLNTLKLHSVKFRDSSVTALVTGVMLQLDSLTFLDFRNNRLASDTIDMLKAALERPGREINV